MYNLTGQQFINRIRAFYPGLKVGSGGAEIIVRCPFCGDSQDQKHAHLYISVPVSESDLSFYDCKRCPAHGVTDTDLLRKLNCNDSNLIVDIAKHNDEVMKLPKYKSLRQIDIYPLKLNYVRNDPNNQAKLNYINNRIGGRFTIADLINLKIVLNLYDIINLNRLELMRHKLVCDDLDRWFIGFVSYDNSFINMRKVTDRELYKAVNKRYINYALVDKKNDAKDFYVIPSIVDVSNPQPVKIHIAEGAFDILSIYYNLNGCNNKQNIYASCGGKSYIQTLEFILLETGIVNFEVHFYPDNDVPYREFDKVLRRASLLQAPIYIHKNVAPNEKDYGVPMNRIIDTVTQR